MTARPVATAEWWPLEGPGDDLCRLVAETDGWMLVGHARFPGPAGWAALDYVVRCDAAFHTVSADVTGLHGPDEVALRIDHADGQWQVNATPQPGLDDVVDLGLSFTPATEVMPLRRLGKRRTKIPAAWLDFPDAALTRCARTYLREAPERVQYSAPGAEVSLTVHPSGFVTAFPRRWHGRIDAH